jgi:peptidoglycan/xylan/chitin deacetylase (PgdA/CDA1 family)
MLRRLLRLLASKTLPVDYHADRRERVLYLTFDDGPTLHTPRILDLLARHDVPATFFIVGKRIAGREPILAAIDAAGHRLGNHSFSHKSARNLDYAALCSDLDYCTTQIRQIVPNWRPKLYRPPYGDLSLGFLRFALIRRARISMWNQDSMDYRAATPGDILDRLINLQNGDILLFHDEFPVTAAALDVLIPRCLDQGFRFSRMTE